MTTTGKQGNEDTDALLERRKAYHEAGHAVAAYCLGIKFNNMSINSFDEGEGYTSFGEDLDKAEPEKTAIILISGYIAEKLHLKYYPELEWKVNDGKSNKDWAIFMTMSAQHNWSRPKWKELYDKAENILDRNWSTLEAVATNVLKYNILTGEEAEQIISEQEMSECKG